MTGDAPASGADAPASGRDSPAGGANPAASSADAPSAGAPALKVVAGDPSAEELAALTVALAAALASGGGPGNRPRRAASGWADRSRLMNAPLRPGPDAWCRSARPG